MDARAGLRLPRRDARLPPTRAGRTHGPRLPGRDFARGHRLGDAATQLGHVHPGGWRGQAARRGRRRPGGLGERRAGPAADHAHRQRQRGSSGAPQPAARVALAARVHQDPAQRRRLPAPRAQDRCVIGL